MGIAKWWVLAGICVAAPGIAVAQAPVQADTAGSAAPALAAGVKVFDTSGAPVGTIEGVDDDFAVLATARSRVRLPRSSFGTSSNGPVIAMTAEQVDAAAAQSAPRPQAAEKPEVAQGTRVSDMQGGAVGTVESVDGQFATLLLDGGPKVRLPLTAFGTGDGGALRIAMTAAQLKAAVGASGGSH